MEPEFDNDIDILLRDAGRGRTITISEFAGPHVDADELSLFAENLLPERLRPGVTEHLSNCDECRVALRSFISIDSEAAAATAVSAAAPALVSAKKPWYSSLFSMPGLAYGMGSIVLLFTGLIVYTALQNLGDGVGSSLSRSEDASNVNRSAPSSDGIAANVDSAAAANAAGTDVAMANTAAPTRPTPAGSPSGSAAEADKATVAGSRSAPTDFTIDGMSGVSAPPPPPPAPAAAPREAAKPADRSVTDLAASRAEELKSAELQEKQVPSAGNMTSTQAGPSRNMQKENRAGDDRELAKRRTSPDTGSTRSVGGKKFSQRQGVWYDSAYNGERTTNIRRHSDQYRSLDSGLRSIAERLNGVVVVVWKSQAYRIQ